MPTPKPEIFFASCQELIDWLEKNYAQKTGFWLVYYKPKLGKSDLTYSKIVDIALCFGWIDSTAGTIDEEKTKIWFSPRNPKSNWSKVNKAKVAVLMEQGLMRPNGLLLVKTAQENGCWDALNDVENLILPPDLELSLSKNQLLEKWETLSRSTRRQNLELLLNSKKPETRVKRIQKIVEFLT